MAASAWVIFNKFREYVMDNTIDIDGDAFKLELFLSGSNALTTTLSTESQVTNPLASTSGHPAGGKSLTAKTWATGASAGVMRFDSTEKIFSAVTVALSDVRFAVIYDRTTGTSDGDSKLVMACELSTAGFDVTVGNTLTVTPSANGLFELT
jgi:hypothetical protein